MSDNPETKKPIRILSSDLKDPDSFDKELHSIYDSTSKNPRARSFMLSGLMGRTLLRDGETSLSDEAQKQIANETDDPATVAEHRLQNVSRAVLATVSNSRSAAGLVGALGYEGHRSDNGDIVDILPVLYMNQSQSGNNESQRISDQAPYGPKQNDSSFRVSK